MIQSKEDYKYYLECDRVALGIDRERPMFMRDDIWRFERVLRRSEYWNNNRPHTLIKYLVVSVIRKLVNHQYYNLSVRLGFSIPLNVFGPGLAIVHYGTIVVAGEAKVGANCRIHEGVTIGATNGSSEAATIGDNVFIASGAKIIGAVTISSNVAIAANSVVVKHVISSTGCTVGGVPAKVISQNASRSNLSPATEKVDKNEFFITKR